ncbi:MAG: sigma-70 family RNA polymerase sigma factor [Myxococcota bacterium]
MGSARQTQRHGLTWLQALWPIALRPRSMSKAIEQMFLAALPQPTVETLTTSEDWASLLTQGLTDAQQTWPEIGLSSELLAQTIAEQLLARHPPQTDPRSWLETFHYSDFLLAQGCARGIHAALIGFETQFKAELRGVVRRFEGPRFAADDLHQIIRERLFVGTTAAPARILGYSGQGSLRRWFAVTATRLILDQLRVGAQHKRERATLHEEILNVAGTGDWEMEFLKRTYRAAFKEAVATALGELSSPERNLLRLHLVERLSIDQIGVIFNVHRSTAARRLERARQALMEATRAAMINALEVDEDDLDSIIRLVNSRLEASIHRILNDDGEPS